MVAGRRLAWEAGSQTAPAEDGGSLKQSEIAKRASAILWPAWLVVHDRLRGADFAPLRNVLFALFVVGMLAYGTAFAWYMLARFDLVNVLRDATYDDAFYYLQIAYHMAEGRFSTFDGGLTRTNGYHPAWLFLLTPFHWVFDKTEALFAAKAFEVALIAAGVALVAAAARTARLPWILLFALPPTLYAQTGMLFGLEAALVLCVLGLLMLAMCLFAHEPARWRWPLAAVVFALPWVRLECAAVAVAATAALSFLEWSGRLACAPDGSSPSPAGRAGAPSFGFRLWRLHAAVPLAGAFAGILVYFAYNGIVFGGVVPVSGAVKAVMSQREWEQAGGYDLQASFEAFMQSEVYDDELLTALEVCVYALLVWWLARGSRRREDALLLAFLAGAAALAAGHLAKFAQSVLFMHPNQSFQYWYFVPAYLMEALVVPLRCCVGIYLLRRFVAPRWPRRADVLSLAAIVATAAVLVAKADFAEPFRFVDTATDEVKKKDWNVRAYMGVAVMDRLLPEGTLVGSWDGGAIGYFSRLPVMNLDGLANSYSYKEAMEDGSVGAFWQRHGLIHFSNVYKDGLPGQQSTVLWEKSFPFQSGPRRSEAAAPSADFEQRLDVGKSATWQSGASASGTGFDLRIEDNHLVYAKAPCTRDEIADPFLLHVFAVSRDDLPDDRKQYGFDNLDFRFKEHGELDGACLARVPLPDYDIDYVRTGQYAIGAGMLFEAARGSRLRFGGLQFKLYRNDPEWAKSPVDEAAWFWERMEPHLELQADDVGLLVVDRTAQVFARNCTARGDEVAEWTFGGKVEAISDWTQTADGLCSSDVVLPHGFAHPVRVRRAALSEAVAGLAGGRAPAIAAGPPPLGSFDVYLAEDALVYAKTACEQVDVETPFILHLVPAGDHFDSGRESEGFNNLDFMLEHHGDWLGEAGGAGACLAEVPLPPYPIAEIKTGQYTLPDVRTVWEAEIHPRQSTSEGA